MAIEVIDKIQSYKITLSRRIGASPNIYYYFTQKNKVYRGSTKTDDPKALLFFADYLINTLQNKI